LRDEQLFIIKMVFLSIGGGAMTALSLWKLSKKNLASCEAFGISVHGCWQTLMVSRRMEDGRILMKISAPFPLSLINNYIELHNFQSILHGQIFDRGVLKSIFLHLSEENDDHIQS
jgi:hypothetical protein